MGGQGATADGNDAAFEKNALVVVLVVSLAHASKCLAVVAKMVARIQHQIMLCSAHILGPAPCSQML